MDLLVNISILEVLSNLAGVLYKHYAGIVINDYSPTILSFQILVLFVFSKILISRPIKQKLLVLISILVFPHAVSTLITINQSRVALQYIIAITISYTLIRFSIDVFVKRKQISFYISSIMLIYFYSLFAIGKFININDIFIRKSINTIEIKDISGLVDLQYFTISIITIIFMSLNKYKNQNIWKED